MKPIIMLVACVLLSGCWESKGSLYPDRVSLRPFRDGRLEARNLENPEKRGRDKLVWGRDFYRLTNDNSKDSDFGESFALRFFALAGAPAGTLAYEATEPCKASDKGCTAKNAVRYYGLARVSPQGADVINPDCAKNDPLGKRPGVKVGEYGTCDFSSRAELERALGALAATKWKADVTYRFVEPSR